MCVIKLCVRELSIFYSLFRDLFILLKKKLESKFKKKHIKHMTFVLAGQFWNFDLEKFGHR